MVKKARKVETTTLLATRKASPPKLPRQEEGVHRHGGGRLQDQDLVLQTGKAQDEPHPVGQKGGQEEPQAAGHSLKGPHLEAGLAHLHSQGEEEDGDGRLAHEA